MIQWWERINREQVLEAAQSLASTPGLLVLRGGEESGRGVALRLSEEVLATSWACHRVMDTSAGSALARALLAIWPQVLPPPPGVIPPWVINARKPADQIARAVARSLSAAQVSGAALLLEDVDYQGPLTGAEIDALGCIAVDCQLPVVVTSRALSETRWSSPGVSASSRQLVELEDFHPQALRACLHKGPYDLSFDQRKHYVELARGGREQVHIPPMSAYTVMRTVR